MPKVVAFEDVKAYQYRNKGVSLNTMFLKSSAQTPDLPVALLSQGDVRREIKPHWHTVDQFQVIVGGKGRLGRHEISPYCVHFSRAYTPYGPLADDGTAGVAFFTLRAHFDPGPNYVPQSRDKLKQVANRQPWQISRRAEFPALETAALGVALRPIPHIVDDQGLFAHALRMAPNAETAAPDPGRGDGQYLLVVRGSLWYAGKEHCAYTVVFIEPTESAFRLHAGPLGLEALVLNFPQPQAHAVMPVAATSAGHKKWQCEFCAFAYDEALGLPDDGIPAGTRWVDVPADWVCPDCATCKSDFHMVEVESV